MPIPPLVGWLLVLLCAATGGYCLSRIRTGPPAQRVAARGEALMACGMAVMALPASVVTPPAWMPWLFTAVFGAAALWALVRRHPHHAVDSLAMVYMALAMVGMPDMAGMPADGRMATEMAGMPGMTGMTGMTGAAGGAHAAPPGIPLLTGLLLAYYAVYVLIAGSRLVPTGPASVGGAAVRPDTPVMLRACQVAMGLGMFAMLLAL